MLWARRAGDLTVCSELVNPGAVTGHDTLCTRSFTWSESRRLLGHRLADAEIDNDLGDRIAAELVRPGVLRDFEATFAGVVTSTAADPLDAWERFYVQTLAGLRRTDRAGSGAIATFGGIYRHALSLVVGESLLDAGSCFGFHCLLVASGRPGLSVLGTDLSAPTMALAAGIAARLPGGDGPSPPVRFAVADVRRALPAGADTVTALHVLEHLDPAEVPVALRRLCDAARRRVIVAVPLEPAADPTYGHRSAFADLDELRRAASAVAEGWRVDVHAHRGGWLVLDRSPASVREPVRTVLRRPPADAAARG